jgi:RND family efflux transporter MFP subunit
MKRSIGKLVMAVGGMACLALLVFASGCSQPAPASTDAPTPKVTVTPVVSQETTDFDEYTGRTEASEIVEVRSRLFGYLKSVDFKDGDRVTEGQPLFTIEDDEYTAIHSQAAAKIAVSTAQRDLAKSKLARNEKLVKTGAVSQEEYEESVAGLAQAEAAITAAKADVDRTAVDLKYTVIKSPITGRIDRAMVTKGNLLTGGQGSGTLLTKIVAEQPMYIYFDIDERSLLGYQRQRAKERETTPGSLRDLKMACFARLADETDYPHEGELDFAAAEVSPGTGTARIRAAFKNEDRALTSGLFVRVRIPVSKPYQALMVPEQALGTDQSIKYVYVVGDDGIAKRQNVELGRAAGDMRIIKSGVEAGQRVIVKGLQRVRPNQKVEAEEMSPSSSATKSG